MLEDKRLNVFETLAQCGSFTETARRLGISQPAVSQNIAELERILRCPLFEREKGKVSLTDKGKLFKRYADQIVHWYRAADQAFEPGGMAREPVKMPLGDGREAVLWSCLGDIHICLSENEF